MKKLILSAIALAFTAGLIAQQQVFVLYDASCMLRVNYEQAISQQPRMDYFAYQVPLANGNKLILETGVEGSVRQNYLPPNYLACNDPRLSADLAEQVNGNNVKVFMLIPEGNDYLIQPVTMGAVMAKQGNLFTYVSPLASFQFDLRNVIIGENLAFNNANARVFFEGRDGNVCGGTYLIRQLMPRNAYPVIDYKINPELGVMERRLGSDGSSTVGGATTIRSVNSVPVSNYLVTNCGGQNTGQAFNNGPATYGSGVVPPQPPTGLNTVVPSTVTQPPLTAQPISAPAVAPATVATEAAVHTVAKGETLYGISKRYSVGVDQIKEWNNLAGNTINVGQSLRVGQASFATSPVTPSPAVAMVNRGPVATSNPGATQPTPYSQGVAPVQPATSPADQQHVVQAGETVASVALRYGYTEAKFREINGLGANEYIRIGQRLKTSSCNCPASNVAPTPAAPATYGQSGGVVVPQTYQPPTATVPSGTPVGPTANRSTAMPTYRAPNNQTAPRAYGSTPTMPQTATAPSTYSSPAVIGQPKPQTPVSPNRAAPSTFNNSSNFGSQPKGQVIPNVYRAPSGQSMNSLEGGGGSPVIGGNNRSQGSQIYAGSNDNTYTAPNTRSVHVVQEGESLNSIAQRYGLSVDQLRNLNKMGRTDVIIPFQRLYIN